MIGVGERLAVAAGNVTRKVVGGGVADLTPVPRVLVDSGPARLVYRFVPAGCQSGGQPVLLVPPLAAPALCFDLRRGCSFAEHLTGEGRRAYLLDYGTISFSDRKLGVEHWVYEVLPRAIQAASRDSDGAPVHIVAWCLGGIFALLAAAERAELPIASITVIASPFDITAIPLMAPARPLVDLTGGYLLTPVYRLFGSAPRRLVKAAFRISALDKYLTKPWAIVSHLDDREFLAQLEAVDHFTDHMVAYPGRTFGQMYHRLFRSNDLAEGAMDIAGKRVSVTDVRVPVLVIAGENDTLAPKRAVRRLTELLTNAPEVEFAVFPGGHLGVLTGRGARGSTWPRIDAFLDAHGARQAV